MKLFLNDERHTLLATQLTHLGRPPELIPLFTDYPDHNMMVDIRLAANTNTCLKFSHDFAKLPDDADSSEATKLVSFVLADLCILQVYSDEIKDRGLNGPDDFPIFSQTMKQAIEEIDSALIKILESGQKGASIDFNIPDMVEQLGLRGKPDKATLH